MTIAIIGGSGLAELSELEVIDKKIIDTPWGRPSAPIIIGKLSSKDTVFLPRHGIDHKIPPHEINYQANIWALHKMNIDKIISINTVGGITKLMNPGCIVIPDQIIDYTYDRKNTFYTEEHKNVKHIDFTFPYSETLRNKLILGAEKIELNIQTKGTYAVTQGPRLETSAEIIKLERDGCNIVGMTGMPEAGLAKEIDIDYACCSLVVNWAAGKSNTPITMEIIEKNMESGIEQIKNLITEVIRTYI